ncbi:MAG: hypothetical protein GF421_05840 [Candidatus Aminicenantes bacterium]|nr:hypothetical protein [Candidatus Aminicenantes bacterium]
MRKHLVWVLFVFVISSCMSSPDRKYYQIHLEGDEEPGQKTIHKTVLIEPIDVDDLYDDFRVVYRISPYELNYYSYGFWADKPANLIRDSITQYLSRNQIFRKVIQEISRGDPDVLWKSKIYFIEEIDTPDAWYARLSMEIELVDFESKKQIFYHKFDRREKLEKKNIARVPVMLSKILEEELEKVVDILYQKME